VDEGRRKTPFGEKKPDVEDIELRIFIPATYGDAVPNPYPRG
jgi:hypothetical protein